MLPVRSRRGKPDKLPADKVYDYAHLRRWLQERNITPRIARKAPNRRPAHERMEQGRRHDAARLAAAAPTEPDPYGGQEPGGLSTVRPR
jgi:IS5 family transposase